MFAAWSHWLPQSATIGPAVPLSEYHHASAWDCCCSMWACSSSTLWKLQLKAPVAPMMPSSRYFSIAWQSAGSTADSARGSFWPGTACWTMLENSYCFGSFTAESCSNFFSSGLCWAPEHQFVRFYHAHELGKIQHLQICTCCYILVKPLDFKGALDWCEWRYLTEVSVCTLVLIEVFVCLWGTHHISNCPRRKLQLACHHLYFGDSSLMLKVLC